VSSSVINLFVIHFKIKTITLKFKYRIFILSLYGKDIRVIYIKATGANAILIIQIHYGNRDPLFCRINQV